MKTAAIITTVIAAVIFLLTSALLTNDATVGSTKDGMLVFNFFIWFAVPGILWVLYFILDNKQK
jgi:uncharacterized RDD family membrane protein YckC